MSKKNHFESIEAAKIYAEKYPELKELIHSFIRMSEHPKVNCKIQIGKFNVKDKSFTAKLTSNIRFANTLFSTKESRKSLLETIPKIYASLIFLLLKKSFLRKATAFQNH